MSSERNLHFINYKAFREFERANIETALPEICRPCPTTRVANLDIEEDVDIHLLTEAEGIEEAKTFGAVW